jgi:hypothetical protein
MGEVGLGRMVRPAVVTLGEEGDGVDVACLQRGGKALSGEAGADSLNVLGGVKIQVNLAVGK